MDRTNQNVKNRKKKRNDRKLRMTENVERFGKKLKSVLTKIHKNDMIKTRTGGYAHHPKKVHLVSREK